MSDDDVDNDDDEHEKEEAKEEIKKIRKFFALKFLHIHFEIRSLC